jgi:zinc transporter ZupT
MAFAAGAMVMVSFFELVPLARKYGRMGYFALGVAGSVLVYLALHMLFPHDRRAIP